MIASAGRLTQALLERTKALHRAAEQSGIIAAVLCGTVNRYGYALLLRNLQPAYAAMEEALAAAGDTSLLRPFALPEVYRAAALAADLSTLRGSAWREAIPLLPAGERYAERIAAAARGAGVRLIGHAYTRYLGDLSGGQVLKRILERSLGGAATAFLTFPAIPDPIAFKDRYRAALDAAPLTASDRADVLDEAEIAFRLNIDLSNEIEGAIGA